MRQASWSEVFTAPNRPAGTAPEIPAEPTGWRRIVWWEDLVTLGLLTLVLLAVVSSIDAAHWVETMPSLYPIAFFGLFLGAGLARLPWREGFIHLLALPIGAAASLGQIMSVLPGHTPWDRYDVLHDRMAAWFHIAFYGGISNDDLPFITLVVPLVWLTSYLFAWAIFRWQNAWLALLPAGAALLVNISFLPEKFSLSFVLFLLGATLLVTRLHLLDHAKSWRQGGTPYPPLLSLSVLHATFWLGLVLLGLAWIMPHARETEALSSLWHRASSPVSDRAVGLSRLFVSVDNKKSVRIHDFRDILPFLGDIQLPDTPVADVTAPGVKPPFFLRAQAYDVYTSGGWQEAGGGYGEFPYLKGSGDAAGLDRAPIAISVVTSGEKQNEILTVGQPVGIDKPAHAQYTGDPSVPSRLFSSSTLQPGATYTSTGSVSTATEDNLREAGTSYPGWVRTTLLSLPSSLPGRVRTLAETWTAGENNPYDQAVAVETRLHTDYPYDLQVPKTPPGRDTIDYFLFDVKRGYFDYHASAMVVLLRSLGIPARLGIGYVLDPSAKEPGTDRYRITEASAFAWPEVYFPAYGWVEFNPTPNHPGVERTNADAAAGRTGGGTNAPDLGLNGANHGGPQLPAGNDGSTALATHGSSDHMSWLIAGAAAIAVLLVSGAAGLRYAWLRGLSHLDTPVRLWGQTVRLASWARLAPAADLTPREFASALRKRVPGADGADLLAETYVRQRYGREEVSAADREQLEQSWHRVRGALLRRLLRLPGSKP